MKTYLGLSVLALALAASATPAHAQSRGDFTLGVGVHNVEPKSNNGALAGTRLELGDSWGAAVHAGVDFRIGTRGALRVDARWMDIDTDVRVNGARMGTANIDPIAYGVSYIHAF